MGLPTFSAEGLEKPEAWNVLAISLRSSTGLSALTPKAPLSNLDCFCPTRTWGPEAIVRYLWRPWTKFIPIATPMERSGLRILFVPFSWPELFCRLSMSSMMMEPTSA